MPEILGWMIVVGLAVAIAGIFMLASRIERHTHYMIEIVLHNNEMILAELQRQGMASLPPPGPVGVVLERRHSERGEPPPGIGDGFGGGERRFTPGRRNKDAG